MSFLCMFVCRQLYLFSYRTKIPVPLLLAVVSKLVYFSKPLWSSSNLSWTCSTSWSMNNLKMISFLVQFLSVFCVFISITFVHVYLGGEHQNSSIVLAHISWSHPSVWFLWYLLIPLGSLFVPLNRNLWLLSCKNTQRENKQEGREGWFNFLGTVAPSKEKELCFPLFDSTGFTFLNAAPHTMMFLGAETRKILREEGRKERRNERIGGRRQEGRKKGRKKEGRKQEQ